MNPQCAKCEKTVYPMEKLNCLDKYWHKSCFRCATCNLLLNMKNYKGYNKFPYCTTHYPTTKFTAVADTPENLRLAKNTNQQSALEYHKNYETEKGKYTSVADDPETLRLKKNTQQSSDLAYQSKASDARRPSEERRYNPAPSSPPPQQPPPQQYQPPPPQAAPEPEPAPVPAPPSGGGGGTKYVTLYDYNATDEDEVSFVEGDFIIDASIIDDGWMEGRVERTGQYGMMPSNYVEPA